MPSVDASAPPLIAIIDDEESVRRAIKRLITSAGLDVEIYSTGVEFFGALATRQPDCLVLDLHMPGMSGFEIQSQLSQSGYSIPVVAITGHDTPESKSRILAGGAVAYLRKPVQGAHLLEAISSALASKRHSSTASDE
jgi:FixJ family two-component response regulator